ncbi:MAG: amidase family protein [Pseudomonadota bacterium]
MTHTYSGPELCALSAVEAVAALKSGDVSPTELLEAALSRIETVEPSINALPTLCAERARAHIARLGDRPADDPAEDAAVWLAGLPVAITDLTPVAGVRTTFGTKGYADHIPDESYPLVERIERNGGVVIAKSNTPEMGAGANTFNEVFGRTRNPWNTVLNPGGSSGGAAAALATGEVWLAHGSDLGGSLRTPAAYCGVIGMRPSPGRAGGAGRDYAFSQEGVQGPMARTAEDCALLLDAMTGMDPRQPLTFDAPPVSFLESVRRAEAPKRIAYAPDLCGFAPVEPEVTALMDGALNRLGGLGTDIVEGAPDITGLYDCYITLRAMVWAAGPMQLDDDITRHFKKTLRENAELGLALTGGQIIDAQRRRSVLYLEMERLLRDVDALALPVVGLAAQKSEIEFPTEVAGVPHPHYMDWLKFSFLASTVGLPAISVPIGFTANGAPMGIQLIGKPRGEAGLLGIAKAMAEVTPGFGAPIDPITP